MSDNDNEKPLDLEAVEARLAEATPGPWEAYCRDSGGRDSFFLGWEVHGPPDADRGQFERGADAKFIANAPADIAALLRRVRELEGEVKRLRKELGQSLKFVILPEDDTDFYIPEDKE